MLHAEFLISLPYSIVYTHRKVYIDNMEIALKHRNRQKIKTVSFRKNSLTVGNLLMPMRNTINAQYFEHTSFSAEKQDLYQFNDVGEHQEIELRT